MSSLYTEIIQDAYRRPRYRGRLEGATHSAEDENPLCGDMLLVQLRIEDGIIRDARFDGRGCAISQAAAELMIDRIVGQPMRSVKEMTKETVLEELGIPQISPARLKCALLSLHVLKGAVHAGET